MNKYLCLLLLFATGCTFNNDKVVIDVPTGPGNTVVIIPTPPSDVIVTINSNATESSVLNFGVVTTAAPVEKTIEITNTSNAVQSFDILELTTGPFSIKNSSCSEELLPNEICKVVVVASMVGQSITVTQPLQIQTGTTVKTVFLVSSPLDINCPTGYSLSNNLCLLDNLPLNFSYATASLITSAGSVVNISSVLYGGVAPYVVAISDPLPLGLSLDAQGNIAGTPLNVSASKNYVISVTDANNAYKEFNMVVSVLDNCPAGYSLLNGLCTQDDAELTLSYSVSSKNFLQGIQGEIAPAYSGGSGSYTFSVTPALPSGLALNTTNGIISGAATAVSASTAYAVKITNSHAATKTFNLNISVSNPCPPLFFLQNGACVQNELQLAISYPSSSTTLTLGVPFAMSANISGGTAPYSVSISPALPDGLSVSSSTGKITGSPTAVVSNVTYTATVVDGNNTSVSTTFALTTTVLNNLTISYTLPPAGMFQGSAYDISPVVSGGVPLTYVSSCPSGLPAGVSFSSTTGKFTGTPTTAQTRPCTVSIQDILGRTASAAVNFVIQNVPLTLTYSTNVLNVPVGSLAPTMVPTLVGGIASSYSVNTGAIYRGLVLNSTTGEISGVATGLGDQSQVYIITAYTTGGRTATATITVNLIYTPEIVENTVNVTVSSTYVKIVNDETNTIPIQTLNTATPRVVIPVANTTQQNAKMIVLATPAAINPLVALTTNTKAQTSYNLDYNAIQVPAETFKFTYTNLDVKSVNLGQEQFSVCQYYNITSGVPGSCASGAGTQFGGYSATQEYGVNIKSPPNSGFDPTLNKLFIKITKQYGNSKTFEFNDNGSPIINARKLTGGTQGEYSGYTGSYLESKLGEQRIEDKKYYMWSAVYNNILYFVMQRKVSSSKTIQTIYSYDGTAIKEILRVNSNSYVYTDETNTMKLVGNKLYFIGSTTNGYKSLYEYNIDTAVMTQVTPLIGSGLQGIYTVLAKGIVSSDAADIYYFDFQDRISYKLPGTSYNIDNVYQVDDGFIYSTTGSTDGGVYYVKNNGSNYDVRKISNLNEGFSGDKDQCYSVTKFGNYINYICDVSSSSPGAYKLFAYDTTTNTNVQLTNLSVRTATDFIYPAAGYLPQIMQTLSNGTILFYSGKNQNIVKLYRVKGNVVSQVSNFSGSNTVTDNFVLGDLPRKMVVAGNKAYMVIYNTSISQSCLMEYDDDKASDNFRTLNCNLGPNYGTFDSYIYSSYAPKIVDNLKNVLIYNQLYSNDGSKKQVNFINKIYSDAVSWFRDGKMIYNDGNKFHYYDGQKAYQISDTTQDPRSNDLDNAGYPWAVVFKGKILYLAKDKSSLLPRLWEVTLPAEIVAPTGEDL